MRRIILLSAAVLPCQAAALIPSFALAQTGGAMNGQDLGGEIVVTAQRREQKLSDVPQPVQALGGDLLAQTGITQLENTIQLVPGASSAAKISAGSQILQIRGVVAGETSGDATIGYYLDSIPFSLAGLPYAPSSGVYDVERIEVLRGPSGTLYGLGSLGGTIKVLTRAPNLSDMEASVRAIGSVTSGGKPGGSLDAMVNLPVVQDKVAVRGVVGYQKIGGFADVPARGTKNANDAQIYTARVKLLVQPTDDLKLGFAYWRNNTKANYTSRLDSLHPLAIADTGPGETPSDYSLFSGDVEYDAGPFTLSSTTALVRNFIGLVGRGLLPTLGDYATTLPLRSRTFSEDMRITSNPESSFNYIAGFYYQSGRTRGGQDLILPNAGVQLFNDNITKDKSFAIYGELSKSFFDRALDVTLGGRYFEIRRTLDQNNRTVLFTPIVPPATLPELSTEITPPGVYLDLPVTETVKGKGSSFNPHINVAYHPSDDVMLYADVAKGFRAGVIQPTSALLAIRAATGGPLLDNALDPDTLWNYEVGTKISVFDRSLQLELSAYTFDWKDAQIEVSPVGSANTIPIGDVRGRGLDLTIQWRTPLTGLNLAAAGNINSTKLKGIDRGVAALAPFLATGAQLPGVPKNTASIIASYATPVGQGDWELRLNGRYSHRGRQQSLFDGSYAPSVDLLAFRIGVGNGRFDAALFVENATNTVGPMSKNGDRFVVPYPRQFGISIEAKF